MSKVTFRGQKGQIFSADGIVFPAGVTVEVDKLPKGVKNIKLTDGQRKSLGLKAGQSPFDIEGDKLEEKKPETVERRKKPSRSRE